MPIAYNRYYRFDEFTAILHQLVRDYPQLLSMQSAGKSHEGRDIWVLTVTNQASGAAADKPAYWVDANIHASELAGGAAALYLIDTLTRDYGQRETVTRCLDTRAFYICPRMNPDGAEWAMQDPPKIIRSSTRPYPYDEEPVEGLDTGDVDGDGRILVDAHPGRQRQLEVPPRPATPDGGARANRGGWGLLPHPARRLCA